MNDFNEKENLENLETDDESTIFSDPIAHKKTAENVKKKLVIVPIIIAFLITAVIIGAIIWVVKNIEVKDKDGQNTSSNGESVSGITNETILNFTEDDVTKMTVTNENGTYKFYSETVYDTTTNTSSGSEKGTKHWYIEGYDSDLINEDDISTKVGYLSGVVAIMEITKMTPEECGLDKPIVTVQFTVSTGESYTVTVGSASIDSRNPGYYAKVSGSDKIYLINDSYKFDAVFTPLDMANANALPHFEPNKADESYLNEEGVIATFDTITVSGSAFTSPIVIAPIKGANEQLTGLTPYNIISPVKRVANNVDTLFDAFQKGAFVDGAYSFDVSAKSLAEHGLDKPDFVATIKIGTKTLTYKYALQDDGNYAAIADGSKMIYLVSKENAAFAAYTETDFYANWICINSINDIKGLDIVTPDKTYSFGITANPDETSEDKYIITYNGTKIDCQSFQDFYEKVIGISCTDFKIDNLTAAREYSFIFKFKDSIGGENRIDFIKASDTRYQYISDGVAGGRVNVSDLKKIIRELEKLVG